MAITGTGTWSQGSAATSSQQDRDYFSGDVTVANSTYDDTHDYEFGFSAVELHIFNTGSGLLVYQWPRNKGTLKDNDEIPAGQSRVFHCANKTGIRLRNEGGSTTARVVAIG